MHPYDPTSLPRNARTSWSSLSVTSSSTAPGALHERCDSDRRSYSVPALSLTTARTVSCTPAPYTRPWAFSTDALSCAMTSMPSFWLRIICPMITTSTPPGSMRNGMINRTGPHGDSIVQWRGHGRVSISHSWHDDATTTRVPNKRLRYRGLRHTRCSCRVCTSSFNIALVPEPNPGDNFDLSSRGSTGNSKTHREMLSQRHQMRLGDHRIHARITTSARSQYRDARVANGAGISTTLLRRGCR